MAKDNIEKQYKETYKLVSNGQFVKAFNNVTEMLTEASMHDRVRETESLRETYRYMARYLLDGVADSGREMLLSDITQRLLLMADTAYREIAGSASAGYYHDMWRFNRLRNERIATILEQYGIKASERNLAEAAGNDLTMIQSELESLLERIFNTLFTSLGSDRDYADLSKYLLSGYADFNIAAQSLSAITLSFCFYYDTGKFKLLLDTYEQSDVTAIRARALVGIIVAMIRNPERIAGDKSVMTRLSLWRDSLEAYTHLRDTIRAFIGTRDTERVTNKIKDEVLPELMKLRPEIMKKLGDNPEMDAATFEDNPEWAEMLDKSGLDKKMQELSELQSDGADLMMLTFSNLKQFPFFNNAANWFLPFNAHHTSLKLSESNRKLVGMLQSIGSIICDSDLYSMAFATNMMPQAKMDLMFGQLTANYEQLKEQSKISETDSAPGSFDKEVLRVVRDLYRFFKLFRKRDGFFNPFDKPLRFTTFPVIGEMMSEEGILHLIGEFYFKRGYYAEALPLLESIARDNSEDATLYEKIGFCLQTQGRLEAALASYDKAALLKTPGPWLVKKMAYVNQRLGNYKRAAELYEEALAMDPDNVTLIMNTGNMLLQTGDIAGALAQFYHANYLDPESIKVTRALAWTELMNGNKEKASTLYGRIIAGQPDSSDYLNAGHAELLKGNNRAALNLYRLASADDKKAFEQAYLTDIPTLTEAGADATALRIMLDLTLNEL